MQKQNTKNIHETEKIESTIAVFRSFSPEKPIGNAVVYFWESHTDNLDDKEKHQATIELIYKEFDMCTCEKYEVRTGYLNRYNYLPKPMSESSTEEIEEAIIKAKQAEMEWVDRVKPELPGFKLKNWPECVFKDENPYLEDCEKLIVKKIQENKEFSGAFSRTINDYADKHDTNTVNGSAYMLEELSWILSLPLLHLNKPIYLIHVGIVGEAIRDLFQHFSNLQKSVKWLCPKFAITIFENKSDFLMDYRNSIHAGYSYALENKESVRCIKQFKKEENLTREELLRLLEYERSEKDLLSSILAKIPGHVYWLNRDNVYLGCNDEQAKSYGLKSRYEVIGKTNRELCTPEEANVFDKNNIAVMDAGVPYEGEEFTSCGVYKNYLSRKTPLFDTHGKVIGLLGMSIDIADRKRAEELEKQNELQEKIKVLSQQVSHDIQTPLSILSMILNKCKDLTEKDHIKIRNVITSIRSITAHLLLKNEEKKEREIEKLADPVERYILVPYSLEDRINSKECEYQNFDIAFNFVKGSSDPFIFIRGDFSNFFRMMSNLINNAVEALDEKVGVIDIGFDLKGQEVEIYLKDTGKGMPKDIVDKILSDIPIGTTKETGHGIGLHQIKKTLKQMNGRMLIDSKENKGTKITLVFQRAESPKWFVEKITLPKGGVVVVLDDDKSIHDYWKDRLDQHKNDIDVKYFLHGKEAIDFINSSKEKDKIFLLTDYELRNQAINGIDVIEECDLQNRSILITSCYTSKIDDFPKKAEYLKFLIKGLLDDVPVIVEGKKSAEVLNANTVLIKDKNLASNSSVVLLDDSKDFVDMTSDFLRSNGIEVDTYYHPEDFLANLSKYRTDTKIIMDNDFKCHISGEDLANQLAKEGFKKLYVLTGSPDEKLFLRYPDGTGFISKAAEDCMEYLIDKCKSPY